MDKEQFPLSRLIWYIPVKWKKIGELKMAYNVGGGRELRMNIPNQGSAIEMICSTTES